MIFISKIFIFIQKMFHAAFYKVEFSSKLNYRQNWVVVEDEQETDKHIDINGNKSSKKFRNNRDRELEGSCLTKGRWRWDGILQMCL